MGDAARHEASPAVAAGHLQPPSGDSSNSRRHSTGSSNPITYAKSWAEDVQNYHAAKAVLPWLPEQQAPVGHVTRYEKSREERQYDIVLGRFRDAETELGRQNRESSQLKHTLEKGRANQLRTVQRFNMINHAPLYPGAKDPMDKQPVQHPCRTKHDAEYNIVTNIPHPGTGKDTVPASTTGSPSRKPTREFNILTNKYHDRHEDRFEHEAAQAKRLAAQKYFKTRTFDPVRVAYVDEERETDFLSRRREEQQEHGKDRVLLLPPREQFSEGRLYNILNQQVINPGKLATSTESDQRALNKIQKTAFEKKMRVLGESEQARETDLCLNRYAHERHTESFVHGYDVLSNQPYVGRDAKLKVPTRTHAALTSWQAIESGLPAGNKIAPKPPSTLAVAANIRTPPSNPPTRRPNHDDADTRKPNILIIQQLTDAPQALKLPSTSSSLSSDASRATVRTGGFNR